ncbi:MAG: hypothetical protein OEZ43_20905 [Gammaproteobacteria bacterium]|nr:hypothetical protein [Gammaproteobacteria bacterium]
MCFSATASFTTGAVLLPLGIYCVRDTFVWNRKLVPFSLIPFFFAIQQIIEGFVWQSFEMNVDVKTAAYGFLFFSHLFWLFWVPLSTWAIEIENTKKRYLFFYTLAGLCFGLSLYVPFHIQSNWFSVFIINHSIHYETTLIYDNYISRQVVQILYMLFSILPFLFSSLKIVQLFGLLIFMSVFIAGYYFDYAFISVWCYFSAILSIYIYYILNQCKKSELNKAIISQ